MIDLSLTGAIRSHLNTKWTHVYTRPMPTPPSSMRPGAGAGAVTTAGTGELVGAARLGIRELRGRLTSLVRRAGSGERIVITIAGRPVAQLGPVEPAGAVLTVDDLVTRGLLEPATRSDRPHDPGTRIDNWTGGRLDRALREVRGA